VRPLSTLAVFVYVLFAGLAASAAVTTKEIEEALTCQCGCGLTVHSCNHLQCGSGIPLKQEVSALVSRGLDRDEILLHFRDTYGEKILSAPVPEGFNLSAWILPFAVIGAGAGVLVASVRRWTKPARADAASTIPRPEISADDRRRLDAELAKVER
jgi:cytochrome c-type biogenesis protein CcmH/NrfF